MSNLKMPTLITLAIQVPEGVEMPLGTKVEVQGVICDCLSINWGTNTCTQASALGQRLELALLTLDECGGIDDYKRELAGMAEDNELEPLDNPCIELHGTEDFSND